MNKNREFRNDALDLLARTMAAIEAEYAENEHGPHYHSPAEGYAVILEEARELEAESAEVRTWMSAVAWNVMHDCTLGDLLLEAERVEQHALRAAVEAAHTAAAAHKLVRSIDDRAGRYFTEEEESDGVASEQTEEGPQS